MGAKLCKPACCCMNSKVKPKHSRSTSRKSPRRPRRQPSSLDRRPFVDGTGDDDSTKSPTIRKRKSKRERRDENIRGKSQTVDEMAPPPPVGGSDAPFTYTDSVHHATSDDDGTSRTDAYHDDSRRAAQLRYVATLSPMTPTNYLPRSSMPFDDRCSPDIYDTDEDKFPEHQRRHHNEPSYIDAPSARLIDDDTTTIISGPSEVDPQDDEFDRSPASPFGGEKSVNDGDFASCLTEAREAPSLSQRYRSDTQLGNRPYADTRTGSVGGGDSSREGWAEASPQYPQDDTPNVFSSNSGSLSGSLSTGSYDSSSSLSPTGSNRSGAASPRDVGPLANARTRNESSVRTRLEETVVSSRRQRPSTASLSSATTTVSLDDPFSDTSEVQCDASANVLQAGAHVQASSDRHKQHSTTTREPQLALAPPPTARRVSMEGRLLMKIDEMFNAMSQQHSETAIHPRQRHSFYSATNRACRNDDDDDDDDGVLRIPTGCAALLKYLSPEQEHRRKVYRDSVFNKSEPEAVCHRCTCCGVCTRHVRRCFMTGATHGGVHPSTHHVGEASVVCSLTPSRGWMDSMFATEGAIMGASVLSVAVDDVYSIVASIAPDWADVVMSVLSPRCEAIVEALAWSGATSDSLLLSHHGGMTFVLHLTEDTSDDNGVGGRGGRRHQRSTSQGRWSVGAQARSSPPTPSSSTPPPSFSSRVIQRCRGVALNKATMLQQSDGLVMPAQVDATKVTDDERKRLFEVIRIYAEDRRGAAASWPFARRGRWSQLTIGPPPPPCAPSPLEPANAVFGHIAEAKAQPGCKNNKRASTIPIACAPGGPPSLAPQRILRPQAAMRPAARGSDVGLVRARHNNTAEHAGAKPTRAPPANPPNSGALRLG